MKIVSYTALHYGKDYLGWAIRSVIDQVDEHHILYSATGSHGHRTDRPCPDTRAELYAIAELAAGDKLRWHDGQWTYEGQQRDSIHAYAPVADVILAVDADEIWPDDPLLWNAVRALGVGAGFQRWRLPMVHFWRSFSRCVLHDPAFPERIICPKATRHEVQMLHVRPISHLGYAQRPEIIEYKLLTHGHRDQFRHDCDWFRDKFMDNDQQDCHVVGSEYWNPEPVNPWDYLPAFMKDHPYAGLEVIGDVTEEAL